MKLLIVEDEMLLRSELSLCEDWAAMGYDTPLLAEDGAQGLSVTLLENPDVILTDIRMPHMDGLAMLRALREKGYNGTVVVLSGYDEFSYAVEAMRYGVIDYLLKPVSEDRLHEAMRHAAECAQQRRTVQTSETDFQPDNLYMQKALAYLQQHYAEEIHLKDLAKSLFLSDTYLGKLFIQHCGMKFSDYLTQLRIEKAIPLLRDPEYKIYQVAAMVGYREQQYFSNTFKKRMGLTPYQFRHSIGITNDGEE